MVLTRDLIAQGGIARMIAETSPGLRMLTDGERAASLRATLAARPPGRDGVWLFAYGSLIWNPALRVAEQRRARVHGWHRAFCLSTIAGRGTPEAPGLVLGLDRGGACTGAALRIEEAHVDVELDLLWRREMLSGSYQPRWVALHGVDGQAFGHGIAFTIRRAGEYYCRLTREETARRLATAAGARDRAIEALAAAVERAAEAPAISSPAGTP